MRGRRQSAGNGDLASRGSRPPSRAVWTAGDEQGLGKQRRHLQLPGSAGILAGHQEGLGNVLLRSQEHDRHFKPHRRAGRRQV